MPMNCKVLMPGLWGNKCSKGLLNRWVKRYDSALGNLWLSRLMSSSCRWLKDWSNNLYRERLRIGSIRCSRERLVHSLKHLRILYTKGCSSKVLKTLLLTTPTLPFSKANRAQLQTKHYLKRMTSWSAQYLDYYRSLHSHLYVKSIDW